MSEDSEYLGMGPVVIIITVVILAWLSILNLGIVISCLSVDGSVGWNYVVATCRFSGDSHEYYYRNEITVISRQCTANGDVWNCSEEIKGVIQ